MLAALNGLSVARVPGREDSRHDATRVPIDERVSAGHVGCDSSVPSDSRSPPLPRPVSAGRCGPSVLCESQPFSTPPLSSLRSPHLSS